MRVVEGEVRSSDQKKTKARDSTCVLKPRLSAHVALTKKPTDLRLPKVIHDQPLGPIPQPPSHPIPGLGSRSRPSASSCPRHQRSPSTAQRPSPPFISRLVSSRVYSLDLGETLEEEEDSDREIGWGREKKQGGEFVGSLRDEDEEELSMALRGGKPVGYEGGSSFCMETEGLFLRKETRHERERSRRGCERAATYP